MAFTIRFHNPVNRIISDLHLTPGFASKDLPPNQHPPLYDTIALWDTGATASMITQTTASDLKLVPIGSQKINHAGGTSITSTYVVDIYLPNGVYFPGLEVTECPDIVGNVGALIGMDIISRGDFTITNPNGETWMTYRIPSIKPEDYVADFYHLKFAGTPDNAPCPCGELNENGKHKMYKDCHGRQYSV